MALEDSAEEGGIVGMDCAADTDRRLNPGASLVNYLCVYRIWSFSHDGGRLVMAVEKAAQRAYRE
jgi:hypothetical protein